MLILCSSLVKKKKKTILCSSSSRIEFIFNPFLILAVVSACAIMLKNICICYVVLQLIVRSLFVMFHFHFFLVILFQKLLATLYINLLFLLGKVNLQISEMLMLTDWNIL